MNILVCGGAGFIGSAFIRNNLKNNSDSKITNLDILTIGSNLKNLKDVESFSNYKFIKDDIRNESMIDSLVKNTDVIINFAAESHVDRSIESSKIFTIDNFIYHECQNCYSVFTKPFPKDKVFDEDYPGLNSERWAFKLKEKREVSNFYTKINWAKSSDAMIALDLPSNLAKIANQREHYLIQSLAAGINSKNFSLDISHQGHQSLLLN